MQQKIRRFFLLSILTLLVTHCGLPDSTQTEEGVNIDVKSTPLDLSTYEKQVQDILDSLADLNTPISDRVSIVRNILGNPPIIVPIDSNRVDTTKIDTSKIDTNDIDPSDSLGNSGFIKLNYQIDSDTLILRENYYALNIFGKEKFYLLECANVGSGGVMIWQEEVLSQFYNLIFISIQVEPYSLVIQGGSWVCNKKDVEIVQQQF